MREPIKVLIADDNRKFCGVLEEFLRQQQDLILAGVAHDGHETLKLIQERLPDIVILDIVMPHLDGLGVLERLQNCSLDPRPKILVLTALGHEKMTLKSMELGADYYIVKPFDLEVLVQRLRQLADGQKPPLVQSNIALGIKSVEAEVTRLLHQMGYRPTSRGINT